MLGTRPSSRWNQHYDSDCRSGHPDRLCSRRRAPARAQNRADPGRLLHDGWQSLEAAKAAGFDYVELATSEIAGLSDAEFEQAAARDPPGGPARAGDESVSARDAQGDGPRRQPR